MEWHYICCSISCSISHWGLFYLSPASLWHASIIVASPPALQDASVSCMTFLSPVLSHLSKELWLLFLENSIRNQDLSVKHCDFVRVLSCALSAFLLQGDPACWGYCSIMDNDSTCPIDWKILPKFRRICYIRGCASYPGERWSRISFPHVFCRNLAPLHHP